MAVDQMTVVKAIAASMFVDEMTGYKMTVDKMNILKMIVV
jgi:hypothetical protein